MKKYGNTHAAARKHFEHLRPSYSVVGRREYPRFAREHMGQRVAFYYLSRQGKRFGQSQYRFVYGVLVEAENSKCYALEWEGERIEINYTRIRTMWAVDKKNPAIKETTP